MAKYLSSSACQGRRPKNLTSSPYYSRKELLARLIQHRRSPIFLVAPNLSGKTTLAIEYAESIFSFEQVFWFDGQSPCFLRDLDSGDLSTALLTSSENPGLVVIDDLPFISDLRIKKVAHLFNTLIDQGWELIVTMVPANDVFANGIDKIHRIRAFDFLLNAHEIDIFRTRVECAQKPSAEFRPIERMAGSFWHPENNPIEYIKMAITKENMSSSTLLSYFIVLVLSEGEFRDVEMFTKAKPISIFEEQLKHYPYLGLDFCQERFMCHSFSIEDISTVFSAGLNDFMQHCAFKTKGALMLRLADALLGKGNPERACSLVKLMTTPTQRCAWLDSRSQYLLSAGCFFEPHKLHQSLKLAAGSCRYRLIISEGWRLYYLGQYEKAASLASRIMRVGGIDECYETEASLLVLKSKVSEQLSQLAYSYLEKIVSYSGNAVSDILLTKEKTGLSDVVLAKRSMSLLELCLRDEPMRSIYLIESCHDISFESPDKTRLFTRLIEGLCAVKYSSTQVARVEKMEALTQALSMSYQHLKTLIEKEKLGFLEADLLCVIKKCEEEYFNGGSTPGSDELHAWARGYEFSSFTQKNALLKSNAMKAAAQEEYHHSHPSDLRRFDSRPPALDNPIPLLSVKSFGGLEVRIGDRMVNPRLFSRQKVKALLALLIIEQGKELPRNRVARILWPESDEETAQRNLYSIWSLLRKALKTQNGECPYLIRTQFSYKLDVAHLSSDVSDFLKLCRKLLFGNPDVAEWSDVFSAINDIYTGDFMPTETKNEVIAKARDSFRSQLVDSFSMAALRLSEAHEYHMALWFAQVALSHDPTREDAYTLLMKAQAALGQRTAALDTYFKCRKYLSEELGIDPSSSTNLLYQEIISEETGDNN